MAIEINYTQLPITAIKYDVQTGLFPFSPRKAIDQDVVKRLELSISETGQWQPIVVRKDTNEGIAGNHRYLAIRNYYEYCGKSLDGVLIHVVEVGCKEGEAVLIGLLENDFRHDMTQLETAEAVLKSVKSAPKTTTKVLNVDAQTAKQLSYWPDELELDYYAEIKARKRELMSHLDRRWLEVINQRLENYPRLRKWFLEQIRFPSWVRARTFDELNLEITKMILTEGRKFEKGKTWNDSPTSKCLNCDLAFGQITNDIKEEKKAEWEVNEYGESKKFCPHLRLFSKQVDSFVPSQNGHEQIAIPMGEGSDFLPEGAAHQENKIVTGNVVRQIYTIEAYCVDLNVNEPGSCFHGLEREAQNLAANELMQEKQIFINDPFSDEVLVLDKNIQDETLDNRDLPVTIPKTLYEFEGTGQFFWKSPIKDEFPCTPNSCIHAQDDPPGYLLVANPNKICDMVCIHEECGQAAKLALIDWEAEKIRLAELEQEKQAHQRYLEIVKSTLDSEEVPDFNQREILEKIEKSLVLDWDIETMKRVVVGIQQFEDGKITLSKRASSDGIKEAYQSIREKFIENDDEYRKWLSCLMEFLMSR